MCLDSCFDLDSIAKLGNWINIGNEYLQKVPSLLMRYLESLDTDTVYRLHKFFPPFCSVWLWFNSLCFWQRGISLSAASNYTIFADDVNVSIIFPKIASEYRFTNLSYPTLKPTLLKTGTETSYFEPNSV